ncbi:MAG: GNAT family N-acetyltransferase [Rubrivivax sp.]|nr:GNAT family N-acetyltransferase [Rubrivivax sp.]MDP3086013.1 GNAT family N-acetyltransferase [Rubrivivax sp.]
MSDSPVIRRERPDHPQVVALLDALDAYLGTLYAPEQNYIVGVQALLAPEVDFWAAWAGEQAVGCGAVRRMAGDAQTGGQAYGEIKRMFVAPAQRGRRIAERLLTALEAGLAQAGVTLALLETGRDQTEAVRLYERCGYVPRGPFGGYPDNGLSVFYAKALTA